MSDANKNPTRVLLGSVEHPVRFSYLNVFEAKPKKDDDGRVVLDDNGKPILMFGAQIRVPKADKAAKANMDAAVEAAIAEEFGGKRPANLKLPIRDGDLEWEEKEDESLKGYWFFNTSAKSKPEVVGTTKDEFTGKLKRLEPSEIKSGDYGRVTVNFYGFNVKNKGIAVGLGNIQMLKEGEPLGNQRSADADFDDLEDGFAD